MKRFFVALVLFVICVSCSISTKIVSAKEKTFGTKTRADLERVTAYAKQNDEQAITSMLLDKRVVKFEAGTDFFWMGCDDILCNVAKVRKEDDNQEFYVMPNFFK